MRAVAVYILDDDVGGVRLEADAVYVTDGVSNGYRQGRGKQEI